MISDAATRQTLSRIKGQCDAAGNPIQGIFAGTQLAQSVAISELWAKVALKSSVCIVVNQKLSPFQKVVQHYPLLGLA